MQPVVKQHTLPAGFTPQKQQELFEEIVRLYDLADDILESVGADDAVSRSEQMELVTPFLTQATNTANILSAFYTEVVRNGRPITPDLQDTVKKAFHSAFFAYKEFLDGLEAKFLPQEGSHG